MKWIILIIIIVVLFSIFSSSSKMKNKSSSSNKKKKLTSIRISDFIPSEKDSNGNWCTYDTAISCIEQFSKSLGVHNDALNLYKTEFEKLVSESKNELKKEALENDENLQGHIAHYEEQLNEVEEQEERKEIELEIKDVQKAHKKVKNWLDKTLAKLESDCRPPLRKILSAAKKAWNDDPSCYHHLEIDYETPQMPDDYYY